MSGQGTRSHRVVVTRRGGPDVLELIEEGLPEPGPGEVRIAVGAAGVSGYDLTVRAHRFPGGPKPPFTLGEDIVGVVDRTGDGVSGIGPGQRVAAWTFGDGGGYAEYVCRPADLVVKVRRPRLGRSRVPGGQLPHRTPLPPPDRVCEER